jgi:inorganic pyrophosphatase
MLGSLSNFTRFFFLFQFSNFRLSYKVPDGKAPNKFGLSEEFMDKDYAVSIINECHHAWEELISGEKERKLDQHGDEVKDLVRNLSKNSLFLLAGDLDEHVDLRSDDFGTEDSGALFF